MALSASIISACERRVVFPNLRTFFVGAFPTAFQKSEPNNTPVHAQKIAMNTTVTGVSLERGCGLFFGHVEKVAKGVLPPKWKACGSGAAFLIRDFRVLETNGAVIAEVDDTRLRDAGPVCEPHRATRWHVHHSSFAKRPTVAPPIATLSPADVGNFPRPICVFPPGGKAGDNLKLTFFSEATGEFSQEVKLPENALDKYGIFAELDGQAAPSPNWIRVSPFPNVLASTGACLTRNTRPPWICAPPFAP